METALKLKLEAAYGASASRILRKFEVKAAKKQKSSKKQNFPTWGVRRETAYFDRMNQRKENRAVHLARSFLRGTPYKTVEQSTKEGNKPNIWLIHEKLYTNGSEVSMGFIKEWVNG